MQVILNIIYFLIALTVLVCIHEAGHLSMAKLFNVYCDEYSIGFGPKIFQYVPKGVNKKGKPRETKFTIRCIPLGGYVSMAGEGMEDLEEMSRIPKERFLTNIAKWKRAIIMVAGVFLNAVLAIILLIIAYSTIPVPDYTKTSFDVKETPLVMTDVNGNKIEYTSPLLDASIGGFVIDSNTNISKIDIIYKGNVFKYEDKNVVDVPSNTKYEFTITPGSSDLSTPGGVYTFLNDPQNAYYPKDDTATKTYVFYTEDGRTKEVVVTPYAVSKDTSGNLTYSWELVGISAQGRARTFGEVMSHSFSSFGEYSIAIYKALGNIFTKDGFDSLGGPIAIVQQQMTFASNGIGYFLLFWGLISVNLAVINLLPFPGLDGWHFLVVIVEAITRKEINPKVKSVMSAIGMVLLFGLMIVITCKDIIKLFI